MMPFKTTPYRRLDRGRRIAANGASKAESPRPGLLAPPGPLGDCRMRGPCGAVGVYRGAWMVRERANAPGAPILPPLRRAGEGRHLPVRHKVEWQDVRLSALRRLRGELRIAAPGRRR